MKSLAMIVLCALPAVAEEHFGDRGQIVPLGGVGYSHSWNGGGSSDEVSIAPGALWFAADRLGLGLSLGFGYRTGFTIPAPGGGLLFEQPSVTTAFASPMLATVIPLSGKVALFPQAGAGFSWSWSGGTTSHGISLSAFAPLVYIPVPHLFLGFGPSFNWLVSGTGSGFVDLGLQSQIGGWF